MGRETGESGSRALGPVGHLNTTRFWRFARFWGFAMSDGDLRFQKMAGKVLVAIPTGPLPPSASATLAQETIAVLPHAILHGLRGETAMVS